MELSSPEGSVMQRVSSDASEFLLTLSHQCEVLRLQLVLDA